MNSTELRLDQLRGPVPPTPHNARTIAALTTRRKSPKPSAVLRPHRPRRYGPESSYRYGTVCLMDASFTGSVFLGMSVDGFIARLDGDIGWLTGGADPDGPPDDGLPCRQGLSAAADLRR